MKYSYPAIFTPDEKGWYSVRFPDIPGCLTCGKGLDESVDMAEDALALVLSEYEFDKKPVPPASSPASVHAQEDEVIRFISVDTAKTAF